MTQQLAELFCDYGAEVHENYSGRGMYGEKTYAVSFGDINELFRALSSMIPDLIQDQNMEDVQMLADGLKKLRSDNLGLDTIYY